MGKARIFAALFFAGALVLNAQESSQEAGGGAERASVNEIIKPLETLQNNTKMVLDEATKILSEAKLAADNATSAARDAKAAAGIASAAANEAKAAAENVGKSAPSAYEAPSQGKLLGREVGIGNIAGFSLVAALAATASFALAALACWLALAAGRKAQKGADNASNSINDATHSVNGVLNGIETLQGQIATLAGSVAGPDAGSLKKQLNELGSKVENVSGAVTSLPRKIEDLPKQFEAVKTQLAESIRTSAAAVDALPSRMQDGMDDLKGKLLEAVQTDAKLQKLKLELQDRENEVKRKEAKIVESIEAARKEGEAKAKNESAVKQLEEFRQMLIRHDEAIGKLATEKRLLENDRDNAVKAKEDAEAKAAALARERDNANKKLEAANAKEGELTSKIQGLEGQILQMGKAIQSERETMRETVAKEVESQKEAEYATRISALEGKIKTAEGEQSRAAQEITVLRGEKDSLAKDLAAKETALGEERSQRKTDAENAAKALKLEQEGRVADKVAAATLLDEEKKGRIADRDAAAKALESERSGRAADAAAAAAALAAEKEARVADAKAAGAALAAVKTRLFPPPFGGNAAFEPLLSELDVWDAEGIPGAALARASLSVIANRERLPDTIWQNALFDLSLGLSSAMEAKGVAAAEAAATLAKWKTAVEALRASGPSFSLNLPMIGRSVDMSWMRSQSNSGTVRRIRAWAVYNRSGLVCLAEVE